MLFAFSACKNDKTVNKQNNSTTSTTEKENLTDNTINGDNTDISENQAEDGVVFYGKWYYAETASPQAFYGDFYNSEITKTNVELKTVYNFNSNGAVSITVEIANISEVRKEYRSLMVAVGKAKLESEGKILTTDDVLYYEDYADEVLKSICAEQKGTYEVGNNRIYYKIGDESYSETYTINGNRLTLTGSSKSEIGYPVILTKIN